MNTPLYMWQINCAPGALNTDSVSSEVPLRHMTYNVVTSRGQTTRNFVSSERCTLLVSEYNFYQFHLK